MNLNYGVGTEDNYEYLQWRQPCSWPKFEPRNLPKGKQGCLTLQQRSITLSGVTEKTRQNLCRSPSRDMNPGTYSRNSQTVLEFDTYVFQVQVFGAMLNCSCSHFKVRTSQICNLGFVTNFCNINMARSHDMDVNELALFRVQLSV